MNAEIPLGRSVQLQVTAIKDEGAYVDGAEYGSLFVPHSQLPRDLKVGDQLRVFLYADGGRVLATARRPYLELGMAGSLKVNSIDCGTVYLDMGIPKELVVPVSEQRGYFDVGAHVIIYVAIDDQGRLFGTQRFNRYVSDKAPAGTYQAGDEAVLVPLAHTPLGVRAIVDDRYFGLIHKNEIKGELRLGKRIKGYIRRAREDGRLDLTLQEPGRSGVEHTAEDIYALLQRAGGELPFGDKTAPEEIEAHLHMSKGRYKKAIGALYRQRKILIEDQRIVQVAEEQ